MTFFMNSLRKLLKVPDGMAFVWWLLESQKSPRRQLASVAGLLLLYGAMFYIQTRSVVGATLLALNLLLAMTLHEWGHWIWFVTNGIKALIRFLFPLGAIAAPVSKEEDAKSDLLPWWTVGWLILGGPAMNVVLMGVGHLLTGNGHSVIAEFGKWMVVLNGWLAISNLFPLGKLDAGQLYKYIFDSLKREHDHLVAAVITVVSLGIVASVAWANNVWGVLGNLIVNLGIVLFFLLLPGSIWHAQHIDNDEHWKSPLAMKVWQVTVLVAVHLFLVVLALRLMM